MEKENLKENLDSLRNILRRLQVLQVSMFDTYTMYVFMYKHEDCTSISASFLYGEDEIISVNMSSYCDIKSQDEKYEKFTKEIYSIINA